MIRFPLAPFDNDETVFHVLRFVDDKTLVRMQCLNRDWKETIRRREVWQQREKPVQLPKQIEQWLSSLQKLPFQRVRLHDHHKPKETWHLLHQIPGLSRVYMRNLRVKLSRHKGVFQKTILNFYIVTEEELDFQTALWFMNNGMKRHVHSVGFSNAIPDVLHETDKLIELLQKCPVERLCLDLWDCQTLHVVKRISESKTRTLRSLYLNDYAIKRYMQYIANINSLRAVEFKHMRCAEFRLVPELQQIEELRVKSTIYSGAMALEYVLRLKNLQVFECWVDSPRPLYHSIPADELPKNFHTFVLTITKHREWDHATDSIASVKRLHITYCVPLISSYDEIALQPIARVFPNVVELRITAQYGGSRKISGLEAFEKLQRFESNCKVLNNRGVKRKAETTDVC